MTVRKSQQRFIILLQLLLILFATTIAIGQSYIYSDREILFDDVKERSQMMLSPDGNTHVWCWGRGRVTLDVYDKQLRRVESDIVSRQGDHLMFANFKSCYYVLVMEPKTTRVLCIRNNNWEDKTADFNKIPIEELPIAQLRQSNGLWFFVQYSQADDDEHSRMHITAVDSNLQYINSMHLTLKYTASQLRRLRLHTLNNDLLLINTSVEDMAGKLSLHKLNILKGTVRSNSFRFDNEMFVPQEILSCKNGFIVQGHGSRPLLPPRQQSSFTRLLQVDSNLQQINRYCTAMEDSTLSADALCHYLPVSTTLLPNNQLLVADYQRNVNPKKKTFETQLRLHQLDSVFGKVNTTVQTTKDYSGYPSLVFSNGPQILVFYEEMIKSNLSVVHRYSYGDGPETDRILQLNPKNRYFIKNAIRTSETSFVMPYLRNYKLGLVRVNVPAEY